MRIRNSLKSAILALLVASAWCNASEAASASYRIDISITRDGALIGKPAIVAEAGAQAEVSSKDPKNPDEGFRVLVTASPSKNALLGGEGVKLDVEFFGRLQDDWVLRGKKSAMSAPGATISFSFAPNLLEVTREDYTLTLTTSPVGNAAAPTR